MDLQAERPTLICVTHQPWQPFWQRPQQLMSRLASRYTLWYVELPGSNDAESVADEHEQVVEGGVRLLRPRLGGRQPDEDPYQVVWNTTLSRLLERIGQPPILWVSSPLANTLVERAAERVQLVVYDCTGDLAGIIRATPALAQRETQLIARSDLVVTDSYSLYQEQIDRHPRVHCVPSGVDAEQYRQPVAIAPAVLDAIPRPRLVYIGPLDARLDWALIGEIAHRRPAWHWTLIGPVSREQTALPQADNIHYLGPQPYAELPSLLQNCDVATLPLLHNAATATVSPTPTLDYLAAGRWVIGSPLPDLVEFYHDIVVTAEGATHWTRAIESMLRAQPARLQQRLARAERLIGANGWDAIATRMAALIDEQLEGPESERLASRETRR